VKTESTKKSSDSIVVEKTKTHKESVDKINIIVDQILKNENIVDEFIENINENNSKVTSTLVNPGESSLSPRLNRSPDPVHSANSNDTSPDSEVMSTLSIAATEEEKKKLFSHPNSVEEELPHVPTTLPLERSVAVPIIPVKHRIAETKTCSLDRPTRCSTPNNSDLPSGLGTYAIAAAFEEAPNITSKLQITLPKFRKPSSSDRTPAPPSAAGGPPRRRRARSVNAPAVSCGRWVDFGDDCRTGGGGVGGDDDGYCGGAPAAATAAAKPRSPKKITALPMSMRPRRRSSSATNAQLPDSRCCGCDCHHRHPGGPSPDAWPATPRTRSDTT